MNAKSCELVFLSHQPFSSANVQEMRKLVAAAPTTAGYKLADAVEWCDEPSIIEQFNDGQCV